MIRAQLANVPSLGAPHRHDPPLGPSRVPIHLQVRTGTGLFSESWGTACDSHLLLLLLPQVCAGILEGNLLVSLLRTSPADRQAECPCILGHSKNHCMSPN
jgi:hypothetical protein